MRLLSLLVCIMIAASPACAQGSGTQGSDVSTADGIYEGMMRCDSAGSKGPSSSDAILVPVIQGQARFNSATESWRMTIAGDGAVTVTGSSRTTDVVRPTSFNGSARAGIMRLQGHRGGRSCFAELSRGAAHRSLVPIQGAYDPGARRAVLGLPNSGRSDEFVCPPLPAPVEDLRVDGFYAPETNSSVIDPQAMALYREATGPLGAFQEGLTRMADRDLTTAPRDPKISGCALSWLDSWARAGALLGPLESRQSRFERKWFTSTVAIVYHQLRLDGVPGTPAEAARIQAWMRSLAYAVLPDYALPATDTASGRMSSARNNHLNWAALMAVAVGKATGDAALLDWGVARALVALREVDAEGYLPLELQRRSKARHYHLFAVKPVVMIAEMVMPDGVDLYQAENGALRRLARRCVLGLADPSGFTERAGATQEFFQRDSLSGSDIAWLEPFDARFPSADQTDLLIKHRSVRDRRLGGDLTRRFSPLPVARTSN